MASSYTQDTRVGEFKTPLGKDKLVLTRFSGSEAMSRLFEFRIEALSKDDGAIDFDPALGKNCTVSIDTIKHGPRYFVGTLVEAQRIAHTDQGFHYLLVLRPWLYLLSKAQKSRIFHKMTAPDIIAKVFNEDYPGLALFDRGLGKDFPELEYCVQHRESDMDFVCRLMEAHGISYHFVFEDDKQTLMMGDGPAAYRPVPGGSRKYFPQANFYQRDEEHLFHWVPERRFTTGLVTVNDYKFQKPTLELKGEKLGDAKFSPGQLEHYGHPYPQHVGENVKQADGNQYAEGQLHAFRAEDEHAVGSGDCVSLAPGQLMQLENHPNGGENQQYLVLGCSHSLTTQLYRSGAGADGPEVYQGTYEFLPKTRPFAPPMVTPRPQIAGVQTAKVVGDADDYEIFTDEHGRIKVHFHWDRKDEGDPDGQSMWCRVAQVWAGKEWGGIFIPRIGMEVLVQFIDGDPDRPIVVGSVYNGDNKPPYPLPDESYTAGWKSKSERGQGYNEFVFIDKESNELVRLHAEKDLESVVENDEKRTVKYNRKTSIGFMDGYKAGSPVGDDTLDVGKELNITAGMKITLTVGQSTIVMDQTSIKLTSPMITVTASGQLKTNGGALAEHTAGGPMTISAPMVKIN